jgi:hypothetical protein
MFDQIPLSNVSFNDHEQCCTAHGFYIVAAEEQGLNQNNWTIQMIF